MPAKAVSHIAIAVSDIDASAPFYRDLLGLELVCDELIADQKVRVMLFRLGDIHIELVQPTAESSPVAKFLRNRGEGIHHIAYDVDDLPGMLQEASAFGLRLIDEQPKIGADGKQIAFLHPKSTFGVLTEFCSDPIDDEGKKISRGQTESVRQTAAEKNATEGKASLKKDNR